MEKIQSKFKDNPNTIADNLISILATKSFLYHCYERIKRNKGFLTEGTDKQTAENITDEWMSNLAASIYNGMFRFSPARRIMIPKPGKATLRPLSIPNFKDRNERGMGDAQELNIYTECIFFEAISSKKYYLKKC